MQVGVKRWPSLSVSLSFSFSFLFNVFHPFCLLQVQIVETVRSAKCIPKFGAVNRKTLNSIYSSFWKSWRIQTGPAGG